MVQTLVAPVFVAVAVEACLCLLSLVLSTSIRTSIRGSRIRISIILDYSELLSGLLM